jgi:N-acyl homoserine lactone hydrolase
MLAGKIDGVSPNEKISIATLRAIKRLTEDHPTVYLPTHDPLSATRLASRSVVSGG